MQKILDFIASKNFRNAFCFIVFTFLMTAAISSQNYFFQKVIENGISKVDIIAGKDIKIIDTQRTELRKKEVARSVEPILTLAGDDFITSSLVTLQKSVMEIRENDSSDAVKEAELSVLFDEPHKKNLISYLLRAPESEVNALFAKSKSTLTGVLNTGITARDFDNNTVTEVIKKNISATTPRSQVVLITSILNQVLAPNLVVNEFATNIAVQNAQDAIKPYEVIFKKGQKIVSENDPVYKVQRDALRAAGYNILEINFWGILGVFALVAFFTFVFLQYEKLFEKNFYTTKYMLIMSSFTFITALVAAVFPTEFSPYAPYLVPIPAYTILLSIFTTPRNAFVASTILLALLTIGMHYNIEVVIIYMLLNAVIMTSMSKLKFSKRSDLLIISLKITLAGVLIAGSVYFLEKYMMDIDNLMILKDLGYIVFNCFVIGGILILGILPIIETVYGVMTPYGLSELIDSDLLKKLFAEAPGTYHHSLIVSQLVEAAAEAVGADPVLARVGTMYHDIGKLARPPFFVENQAFSGINNPHNTCTPRFSKMIIIAHPKDGVELAKEYHLPQIIHNFILQHHGTSLVSYFYNEALKEEGDKVKEEQFRYPGPKPNMKETAILMIADAVESAVRAAKNPSGEEIDAIIQKIIKERINDGQLEESPLTLKDLKVIAESFSKTLRGMHHKRIQYNNDLVKEFDKNKQEAIAELPPPPALDADLESKIKELENKKNDNI